MKTNKFENSQIWAGSGLQPRHFFQQGGTKVPHPFNILSVRKT